MINREVGAIDYLTAHETKLLLEWLMDDLTEHYYNLRKTLFSDHVIILPLVPLGQRITSDFISRS